ncbi:serine O-acetyltransferase [Candidatus Albibeggiatoa sp. nov. NOAA]|uniref:serine O-acetyltransferase n=1 Tax=Candidatus Albibeggiatoa sp. nov. NOAA TaxID=3162724 RepID=UPI00333FC2F3
MGMVKDYSVDIEAEHQTSQGMTLWQLWKEDVACVFQRDPAARNSIEVLTTYPGVHAILIHRISNRLWLAKWRYIARLLAFLSRMFTNIDIHPGATIGRRFFIDHGIGVVIGETAVIGDDCTLYHGVTLGGTSWNKGKRHPTLGNGVLVGAGAKILGAITLGDDVRVGSNSVVVKDAPANSTVIGIPGKVVQTPQDAEHLQHGVDLNHHLIPDPVAHAMACMLERIATLEKQVNQHKPIEKHSREDDPCPACDALNMCLCENEDK